MAIYLDILLILNLFIDYFLLLSSAVLMKRDVKKRRLIFASIFGSFSSLLIFLPSLHPILMFLVKFLIGVFLVLIAFGYKTRAIFFKTILLFLSENLIFIGIMFFLWMFFSPPGMFWKNGVTYVSISPIILILGTLVAYFLTCFINFAISRRIENKKIYLVKIEFNEKNTTIKALYDSGNCLKEPFSGKSVFICEYSAIFKILPESLIKFFCGSVNYISESKNCEYNKFIRLIPCDTVAGCTILPAFLPQNMVVLHNNVEYPCECYVAVTTKKISDGEYSAIIGDFR